MEGGPIREARVAVEEGRVCAVASQAMLETSHSLRDAKSLDVFQDSRGVCLRRVCACVCVCACVTSQDVTKEPSRIF